MIARDIWRIVRTIRETGIATIIVDKNFAAISAITDRNVILEAGLYSMAPAACLVNKPQLLQSFLGI